MAVRGSLVLISQIFHVCLVYHIAKVNNLVILSLLSSCILLWFSWPFHLVYWYNTSVFSVVLNIGLEMLSFTKHSFHILCTVYLQVVQYSWVWWYNLEDILSIVCLINWHGTGFLFEILYIELIPIHKSNSVQVLLNIRNKYHFFIYTKQHLPIHILSIINIITISELNNNI